MLSRALFVITLTGWVIFLTYTTMAAAFVGVPNLPEATRAAVLSLLVTAGFAVLLRVFGARLVARLATELRRAIAEAIARPPDPPPPAAPPAVGHGELLSAAYLSDAAELYELGRLAERKRREPPFAA